MENISADQPKETAIQSEYITLGQLLKFAGIIAKGGDAKHYLSAKTAFVNGEKESRRGRKLRPGDVVALPEGAFKIVGQ
jgi:ribosome-associated protein